MAAGPCHGPVMADEATAVIVGANGLVGSHCLQALLSSADYGRVVALVRRPLAASNARLTQKVVDFEALSDDAFAGVTDFFCALGTTRSKAGSAEAFRKIDHGYALAAAERASKAGAKQMALVSSVGADASASALYMRVKGELERDVSALPFSAVHIFRPSLLLGDRAEHRTGEKIATVLGRVLQGALVGGLRKYRPIGADVVGAAMVNAARGNPPGRHIYEHDAIVRLAEGGGAAHG
jgi:uncharacterized protein YbjT (DUF2867 family)